MDNKEIIIDKKLFDLTFPLLERFRELAPGSFKHCQNVSNMCESVAKELDLNIDLTKVAALYHDIGKMNNPLAFIENQGESNLHNELDPAISYQIITRHVGDSVIYLLQIPGLPREVIDIVSQHHGDTVLQAFYSKATSEPEDKFRYKCKKPQSDEALILMLCDQIEATVKSIYNSGKGNNGFIKETVDKAINRLMDDEQLDSMRIGTLTKTKKIIIKELESIYHKRIDYEDIEDKTVGELREES